MEINSPSLKHLSLSLLIGWEFFIGSLLYFVCHLFRNDLFVLIGLPAVCHQPDAGCLQGNLSMFWLGDSWLMNWVVSGGKLSPLVCPSVPDEPCCSEERVCLALVVLQAIWWLRPKHGRCGRFVLTAALHRAFGPTFRYFCIWGKRLL